MRKNRSERGNTSLKREFEMYLEWYGDVVGDNVGITENH